MKPPPQFFVTFTHKITGESVVFHMDDNDWMKKFMDEQDKFIKEDMEGQVQKMKDDPHLKALHSYVKNLTEQNT